MKNSNLDDEVKLRVSKEEKAQLKALATEAGVSMSDLIRQAIYGDGKLVFLTEGSEIAKALFEIQLTLNDIKRYEKLPEFSVTSLINAINNVNVTLFELTERLTDIHSDKEGYDD